MPRPKLARSAQAFQEAQRVLVGGVNSPVRAFQAVGGSPIFMKGGKGCRVKDLDGNTYIDFCGSWGPLILGHAHPVVVSAVKRSIAAGSTFGAPTERETELAELIRSALPSMERIRFVSSGTEAAMSAIRVARAFTKRDVIVKFDGCYHGHADGLVIAAGSGATTLGTPTSPGVPAALGQLTTSLPFNDLEAARGFLASRGREVAAVIVEPIPANMGLVPPRPGFLEGLRKATQECGALLIFDEVITGFRVCFGGAQTIFGIAPDLTILGKIIGGGMPLAAYGGRKDAMEMVSPSGPVYQAGTLSGNPIATAAGYATLREMRRKWLYDLLEARCGTLVTGIEAAARKANLPATFHRIGSMFTPFFQAGPIVDYKGALKSDTTRFGRFFWMMLEHGIYFPPSQYETSFLSIMHTEREIEKTIRTAFDVMPTI